MKTAHISCYWDKNEDNKKNSFPRKCDHISRGLVISYEAKGKSWGVLCEMGIICVNKTMPRIHNETLAYCYAHTCFKLRLLSQ